MMKHTFTMLLTLIMLAGISRADDAEFRSLFNGENLKGWDGDDRFWRVENGEIIGETTARVTPEHNTFLIYRPEEFGDFELRFQYQVRGFNSGVQYRSVDAGDYVVTGLQSDFEDRWHPDGERTVDRFSGMFFEEGGRMFLGQRGDAVLVEADPGDPHKHVVKKIGSVGDPAELERTIHRDGWNEMTVIAEGNTFVHIINGRVMAIGIDEHKEQQRETGIIAFQLHKGPPMQIRVKDVQIRSLD